MEFLGTIILLVYFLVKWIISILPFVAIAVFAVWAINMFTKPKTVHVIVDEPKSLPHGEMSQEQVESECIGAARKLLDATAAAMPGYMSTPSTPPCSIRL
jgi:hypothetical protein